MPGRRIGSLIAAMFGLIYVLVNAGPLPAGWAMTLRLLAALAFAVNLVAIVRAPAYRGDLHGPGFGRRYWLVVAFEAVGLFVGVRVIDGPLNAPQAGVAWVSVVVGLHFFALARVFGEPFFHALGTAITACGGAGLVLGATGAADAMIALVSGVLPGAVLLGAAWWGARRSATRADQRRLECPSISPQQTPC